MAQRIPTWSVVVDDGANTQTHTVTGYPQYKDGPWLAFVYRVEGASHVAALFSARTIVSVTLEGSDPS